MRQTGVMDEARSDATPQSPEDGFDFDLLYHQQWEPMIGVAVLLTGDRSSAEDATQNAFVALYRKQHRVPNRAAAIGFVRAAVVNQCRNVVRSRRTLWRKAPLIAVPDHVPDIGADVDTRTSMWQAVQQLPTRMREVVVLRYYADLSEQQIAETLRVSVGTVKSSANRALSKLKTALGEEKHDR